LFGGKKSGEGFEQSCLAHASWSDDADKFSLPSYKRDICERNLIAVRFAEPGNLDQRA
jgi:hypothetical protein